MATLTFNPPCLTPPTRAEVSRAAELTPLDAKFVIARQVNEHEDEVISLVLGPREPVDVARYVEDLWRASFGGTLPMNWQPPDGRPAIEVRFGRRPEIQISQDGHATCDVRVSLEKRII